jgi:predicted CopG family antitoxin
MHMGTKTIRLDDEAYERLASRKREDESFSDVVKRVTGERSLLEIAGILSDDEAETMRETVAERR